MNKELCHELKVFLSNIYVFYTRTQGFHWNVEGQSFFELHTFFQEVYETLLEEIDVFAERIRALGDYPPASLTRLLAMSSMSDEQEDHADALKMVDVFLKNTHTVTEQAKKLCHLCEQHGDLVTQDRLIGFIYKMDEAAWKAKSFINSKA